MEVIPFEAASEDTDDAHLPHLLFDGGVLADVEQDQQAHEEQFVLFPDQDVKFLELGLGADLVLIVVLAPQLDVLRVQQVESLDLILQHIDHRFADLMLRHVLLELPIVGQDVEDREDGDVQVDALLVVLADCSAQHLQEGF